jgi:hypothetical protein
MIICIKCLCKYVKFRKNIWHWCNKWHYDTLITMNANSKVIICCYKISIILKQQTINVGKRMIKCKSKDKQGVGTQQQTQGRHFNPLTFHPHSLLRWLFNPLTFRPHFAWLSDLLYHFHKKLWKIILSITNQVFLQDKCIYVIIRHLFFYICVWDVFIYYYFNKYAKLHVYILIQICEDNIYVYMFIHSDFPFKLMKLFYEHLHWPLLNKVLNFPLLTNVFAFCGLWNYCLYCDKHNDHYIY